MDNFFKILKGLYYILFMIVPAVIGLTMIATGNGSSGGGSWKQKRERYEKERSERLYKENQEKQRQQNAIKYQSVPVSRSVPVYSSNSSRSNYAELWDECEDLESALDDAGIDHDDLSYPMDYHDLEDLRDEYQSLLEENGIDY